MKLGLDIHGVLDTNPKEFVNLAKKVRREGGEVHIITGSSITPELYTQLTNYNNGKEFWDHIVSIEDELSKLYPPIKIDGYGRPNWKDEDWDRFKGDYCKENRIDVHYDDTERYTKYFTTPIIILCKQKNV